ncbi:Gfo/Idh/MocA family oxidoreductase [Actinoplanes sp. LDG1-06]|uniref:Gfo/Idh/MocA family oxidoreductase n=1 Tax=Paractinoplanes ovalisporus TaxID=2810368 RepID=A0ABS2AKM1_9ACTN|nr:Gfo/Idh/MocA family oxidoreductase [Actinoplanes ovalisporus]MBM2620365.1 Gfo/Idh/MocA family oxidoreductase [Actinoplanes ovalisporus]
MTTYRHAIIGCGRVAPNHADGFGQVPGWAVEVACDRDAAVEVFAKEHGIPRWTRDLADVLADETITSVSVAVDHAQHAAVVRSALNAGKHVLVEKPICLDVAEARELVALARARGLVLSVVAQHRYDPVVLAVREWFRAGLLGDLVSVSAALQAHRAPEYYRDSYWRGTWAGEGGSALINQGYHCLDAVRWICGDLTVQAAAATTHALAGVIETEETISGLLAAGDAPVTLSVTVASPVAWKTRIDVVGQRGSVAFDLDHPGRLLGCDGPDALVQAAQKHRADSLAEEPPGVAYYGVSHRRQIADFGRAVAGGTPMLTSADDAVGTLATVLSLYDKALPGR